MTSFRQIEANRRHWRMLKITKRSRQPLLPTMMLNQQSNGNWCYG